MRLVRNIAIALSLLIITSGFIACEPNPETTHVTTVTPTTTVEQAAEWYAAVLHFAAAVEYAKILDYAAAVEAAKHPQPGPGDWPWPQIADCESGGDPYTSAGSFEGLYQFTHGTWVSYGGREFAEHAYQASPYQQWVIAVRTQQGQGWGAWPVCSRVAGVR